MASDGPTPLTNGLRPQLSGAEWREMIPIGIDTIRIPFIPLGWWDPNQGRTQPGYPWFDMEVAEFDVRDLLPGQEKMVLVNGEPVVLCREEV